MNAISRQIGNFLFGVMFLTSLPVPRLDENRIERLARAAVYFPLIGSLIGTIVGVVYLGASLVFAPPLAAALAIVASLLLTGALHEDGLADTFDGFGGATPGKRLEIMRDSRIGTYGASALMSSIALRWIVLSQIGGAEGLIALIVSHSCSRSLLPAILVSNRYARGSGLARSVAGSVNVGEALLSGAIGLTLCFIAGIAPGLLAFAVSAVAGGLFFTIVLRKFEGYTGDSLGAVQQIAEISALLALVAIWG